MGLLYLERKGMRQTPFRMIGDLVCVCLLDEVCACVGVKCVSVCDIECGVLPAHFVNVGDDERRPVGEGSCLLDDGRLWTPSDRHGSLPGNFISISCRSQHRS